MVSGTRPTGSLHLGHLNGALRNWVGLQADNSCFFFVADWHALTTEYSDTSGIPASSASMVLDWLAVGLDPENSVIFRQSDVPEHAELHLLLSMVVPVPWLERVPSYKEQQEQKETQKTQTDNNKGGIFAYYLLKKMVLFFHLELIILKLYL